jgi:hypothetical protein
MNKLQDFIESTGPGRFLTDKTLPELAAIARLCPVLVRAGGCRFICGAQDVDHLERCLKAGGDYIRDVSLTGDSDRFALGWIPEKAAYVDTGREGIGSSRGIVRTHNPAVGTWTPAPHFNEADCGGVFDGYQVTSDADPGL